MPVNKTPQQFCYIPLNIFGLKVNQRSVLSIKEGVHLKVHPDQSAAAICSVLIIFRLFNQDHNLGYFLICAAVACISTNHSHFSVSRRDVVGVNLTNIKHQSVCSKLNRKRESKGCSQA